MKVLLDENLPPRLRFEIPFHDVVTVDFLGWKGSKNGALLALAEAHGFEVFVTVDKNISHQQNIAASKLGFVVLESNLWPRIRRILPQLNAAIERSKAGAIEMVGV